MAIKIFIPIFVILLVGMVAFVLWPKKSSVTVTSLKTALSDAKEIACAYVDADGLDTKTYLKSGMLRSDFIDKKDESNSGGILIKNGKSYVWWTRDKQGFVAASSVDNSAQKDKLVSDMEKYKDSCKSATVSDSLFIIPSDVVFRDFFQKPSPGPNATQEE